MKITDIRATTVTVPLEAPVRHAARAHWDRFVRTIIKVETDEGIVEVSEMGGGESAENAFSVMDMTTPKIPFRKTTVKE